MVKFGKCKFRVDLLRALLKTMSQRTTSTPFTKYSSLYTVFQATHIEGVLDAAGQQDHRAESAGGGPVRVHQGQAGGGDRAARHQQILPHHRGQ